MLVSYIVLTYNQEKTICMTLDSIVRQKFEKDEYEIIICNDVSTDNTLDTISTWIKKNDQINVRVVTPDNNQGTVRNFILGFSYAIGKYIKIIAGDDWLVDNTLHLLVEKIEKENLPAVCGNIISYYEDSNQFITSAISEDYNFFYNANSKEQFKLLTLHNYIYAPAMILRREIVKNCLSFLSGYRFMEDYPMWVILTQRGYKISYYDVAVVNYRIGLANITNTTTLKPHQILYYQDIKRLKQYCFENTEFIDKLIYGNSVKLQMLDVEYKLGQISKKKYFIARNILKIFNVARYLNFFKNKLK